jgi:predicted ATPase
MRVHKLKIKDFKNLRDFAIDFDQESFTTVLVGRNGTGKSNVLEALIIIFRDLDLGERPSFDYELEYVCRDAAVRIDAKRDRATKPIIMKVNGESVTAKAFSRKGGGKYLPQYLFGYYSGPSNRMELHFEAHQKQFEKDLLGDVDKPLRPLLYARLVHSQFVLLSFFYQSAAEEAEFLRKYLRIEDLESVLFVLKKPHWYSTSRRVEDGDPRFWMARGVVKSFLAELHDLALAPLRLKQKASRGEAFDRIYLYLKNKQDLEKLAKGYANPQEFFKALESTYISDLIQDVRTRVKLKNVDGALTFRELSEGEQQLLMVLGLLRFTKEDESLFLLDEPDTHLNPAWSLEYLGLLEKIAGPQKTCQAIMATHDPLVIAGLQKNQVRVMSREENGRVLAEVPAEDPKGMGVAGLLTSEIYGLRSELDLATTSLLDEKQALAAKGRLTDTDRNRLEEINQALESAGFRTSFRDPMYKTFADAMARAEKKHNLQAPVLTKEQQRKRDALATKIAGQVRAEQGQQL